MNGKGSTLIKLGKFNEAEEYFNKSLSITENTSALINKGIISKNRKDYPNALYYYDKAIESNIKLKDIINILKNEVITLSDDSTQNTKYTKKANNYIKKGLNQKNDKKLWDALESYENAILEDHTCKNYVKILINEIKIILEHEFLFETPNFKKDDYDSLKIKSLRAVLIEENPKKALTLMNLILEINENDIEILNHKGCILFHLNKCKKSIKCYDKCLNIDKNYHYALFNKAIVLRRINNLKESLDCFNKLSKIPRYYNKVKPYQLEIMDKLKNEKK